MIYYAGPAKRPEGAPLGVVRPHHRGPHGLMEKKPAAFMRP